MENEYYRELSECAGSATRHCSSEETAAVSEGSFHAVLDLVNISLVPPSH